MLPPHHNRRLAAAPALRRFKAVMQDETLMHEELQHIEISDGRLDHLMVAFLDEGYFTVVWRSHRCSQRTLWGRPFITAMGLDS